jgi:hypothetical protein
VRSGKEAADPSTRSPSGEKNSILIMRFSGWPQKSRAKAHA